MTPLTPTQIQSLRVRSLLLTPADAAAGSTGGVADIVEWFGAMQAQDLASGLWSFGARVPGSTEASITQALEDKEALRTWPMRGTVHFVPSRDAKWMVELMGTKPLAGAAKRREFLGISDATAELAVDTLREALTGGKRMTRAECVAVLKGAGIDVANQVSYHLLWYSSQVGVTCIAPNVGKEQTFVLLDEYVPDARTLEREEALGIMALRYVRGHGPVTVKDMARWTGLGVSDCRAGVAAAGEVLAEVDTDLGPMLLASDALDSPSPAAKGYLALPGFDEYMLGYGDRSLMLDADGYQQVVPGNNGVFRSTLVRDGQVVATWKRTMRAKSCVIDVDPLASLLGKKLTKTDRVKCEAAFEPYGTFVGKDVDVRWA